MNAPKDSNDPFTNKPGMLGATAPASPPPPPMPGQAPPPGQFNNAGWAPDKPTTLALWTTVTTGAVAAIGVLSAALAPSRRDVLEQQLSGDTSASPAIDVLGLLSGIVWIASFVLLAIWMMTIRNNLRKRGIEPGGPPAVEWWGWFVPLAHYMLPYLGMDALARKKVSTGVLLGWWLPFCVYWVMTWVLIVSVFGAIDWTTGAVDDVDGFIDLSITAGYVLALMLAVSWAFLAVILRRVTDHHLED